MQFLQEALLNKNNLMAERLREENECAYLVHSQSFFTRHRLLCVFLVPDMKALALALALIATPVFAADPNEPPEGMYQQPVRLLLNCFDSFARLSEVLFEHWQEVPVMASVMSDVTTIFLFTNKQKTTSTIVVSKSYKDTEESCIFWSGSSEDNPGMSFSLNPNPKFPVET